MSPYLYVRFFDSRRNRWATEEFGRIQYEEEIALADENGERYVTDRPFLFLRRVTEWDLAVTGVGR